MVVEREIVSHRAGGFAMTAEDGSRSSVDMTVLASTMVTGLRRKDRRSIYEDPKKRPPVKVDRPKVPRRRANAIAAVMIISALVLSTYIYMLPAEKGMTVDGKFSDWDDVALFMDDDGDAAYSGINIISTGAVREGDRLFLYVEVIGSMFETRTEGGSVQVFVDSDGSARSGYQILGTGAEYLVEVYGTEDGVTTSDYYTYSYQPPGSGNRAWNWSHVSHIPSDFHNRRIEIAMPYLSGDDALLVFRVSDDQGNEDLSRVLPLVREGKRAPLTVRTTPLIGEGTVLSPDNTYDVLEVEVEVRSGSCRVTDLTVEVSGTVADTDVGQISVMRNGSALDSHLLSDGKVELGLDDAEVLQEIRFIIRMTVAPQATPGTVLTMDVMDVVTTSKAVTSELRGSSWYLVSTPDGHVVDGLFDEWGNVSEDPRGDARRNVDVTGYKGVRSQGKVFFYLGVDGEMMAGAWVPASQPIAASDGVGSQDDLPLPLPEGNDAVYIFLGVQPVDEGYRPQGFPITANRLIVVMGHAGDVTGAHHYRYSEGAPPEWPWIEDPASVTTANGRNELELSVDRDYLDLQVYFHVTTWRNDAGDSTEPFTISG